MSKPNIASTLRRRSEAVTQAESVDAPQSAEDQAYEVLFGGKLPLAQRKRTANLPIAQLCPFQTANIGFKPYSEENLHALADDIDANGLLEAIMVRPFADRYEILSGHNRVAACKLLGWTEIQADIEQVDDNRAIVIATVTNLQRRQGLLPSERGWAYRALLDAQKRQGKRNDLLAETSVEVQQKYTTRETVAGFFGVKPHDIQRDIRITHLIDSLQDAVDNGRLNLMCGVAISYYDEETQNLFLERLQTDHWQLPVAAMQRIKKACPPPHIAANDLEKACNRIEAERFERSKPSKISFNRKRFEPYLSRIGDEQGLENLFLKFLKQQLSIPADDG